MHDGTLFSLVTALEANPQNTALLSVVLEAYIERNEASKGLEAILRVDLDHLVGSEAELPAGRILLEQGLFAEALAVLKSPQPEFQVWRAQALLAADQVPEARSCYRGAVAQKPAVQDLDLEEKLGSIRSVQSKEVGSVLRLVGDEGADNNIAELFKSMEAPITFDDVGGLEDVKKQVHRRVILPMNKPGLFQRFKRRTGGGLLLYGPPGCGKTLMARATAGQMGARFYNVGISDVLDMYIGESEQKLHAIFEQARQNKPCVLFFDEIEALGGKRRSNDHHASNKLISQFLSELDGFDGGNDGVLVMGATNLPWAVDAAFRRPGRFDRLLFIPPPDRIARKRILEILLNERPCASNLNLDALLKKTSGYSGADLRNIVETAVDEAIEASIECGSDQPISQSNLMEAFKQVKATTSEWLTTARNYARYANDGGQYDDVLAFLKTHGR